MPAFAEEPTRGPVKTSADAHSAAPVVVDGRELFRVAGISAYPAEQRARSIAARIEAIAADPKQTADDIIAEETDGHTQILSADKPIVDLYDEDARLERVGRQALVRVVIAKIRQAVLDYRTERSRTYLAENLGYAAVATVLIVLLLWGLSRLLGRVAISLEKRYRPQLEGVRVELFELVPRERLWFLMRSAAKAAWWLVALFLTYFYFERVLSRFPWSRQFAARLLDIVVDPLEIMGRAVLAFIPNLVFLVILYLIVRYVLNLTRLFFLSVDRGAIELRNFEREWALPTFQLVRFGIVAFALVIAFPYLPGSSSDAFKGVSVFIGVLISIGASSMVANALAGYNLLYRRAFRVGDRVAIGKFVGDIVAVRQQTTLLRTPKNEEVVIPNSTILNSEVVNYTTLAKEGRLLLHSSVTIGYDTPWRQVEAMLLEAARRTPGLLREPAPFVLEKALGDFYVEYEINVYCDNAAAMLGLYAALHRNILDSFNEYGVQIMSPHFMAQPENAVVVAKERWFTPPAHAPEGRGQAQP